MITRRQAIETIRHVDSIGGACHDDSHQGNVEEAERKRCVLEEWKAQGRGRILDAVQGNRQRIPIQDTAG